MKVEELKSFLHSLLSRWEDEVVEFKRGGAGFSTGEIGEYVSALANEANLRCLPHAWLTGLRRKGKIVNKGMIKSQGGFTFTALRNPMISQCKSQSKSDADCQDFHRKGAG